ncbi:caspase family protein [Bradyrhizobium sp.]|uniref:caspase family protein n=1 Tax=Bradyrhizobium sp. TaxID=376 RepID=UPI001ED35274|nr:caspase family protein [Bradyrhizobium sp.]MBV9984852.1 caspase family protein [Bradyrhizobium sp.]
MEFSFRSAVACAVVAFIVAVAAPAHAKRVALVIGNNDYKNVPKLQKAVNDARTMGDTLRQLGFEVMVAENQNRQQFSQSLLAFDNAVGPDDTAFFFYAGHGFEIAGQNYLLPTDVPAASEGQEELVRDASVLADRIVERLQNRKVRTSILVFDACRNNPFERSGTRAVAGGGGLAPMTQLPEGVFSIFSAGYKQTALDRLSNNDNSPNSVFTRTFAKVLLLPGENLVEVAQHTRKQVSELAESIGHRQIPAYTDQMVDNVFLNGAAKGQAEAAAKATAEAPQKIAALPPVAKMAPPSDSTNAPIAIFSRHNGGWTVAFSFLDPTLGISWRIGNGEFRETGFMDTLDPRTRKRMPNPSIQLPPDVPAATIEVRYIDAQGELQGPFPIKFDPEAALIHDQRKILDMTATSWLSFREFNGLLVYYTHLVSYRCAIREVRIGIDTTVPDKVLKLPPCDLRDPSAIPSNAQVYMKLAPSTQLMSVELTYRDGSVSEIKTFRSANRSTN